MAKTQAAAKKVAPFKTTCVCLSTTEYAAGTQAPTVEALKALVNKSEQSTAAKETYNVSVASGKVAFKPINKAKAVPKIGYKKIQEIRLMIPQGEIVAIREETKKLGHVYLLKFPTNTEVKNLAIIAKRKNGNIKVVSTPAATVVTTETSVIQPPAISQARPRTPSSSSSSTITVRPPKSIQQNPLPPPAPVSAPPLSPPFAQTSASRQMNNCTPVVSRPILTTRGTSPPKELIRLEAEARQRAVEDEVARRTALEQRRRSRRSSSSSSDRKAKKTPKPSKANKSAKSDYNNARRSRSVSILSSSSSTSTVGRKKKSPRRENRRSHRARSASSSSSSSSSSSFSSPSYADRGRMRNNASRGCRSVSLALSRKQARSQPNCVSTTPAYRWPSDMPTDVDKTSFAILRLGTSRMSVTSLYSFGTPLSYAGSVVSHRSLSSFSSSSSSSSSRSSSSSSSSSRSSSSTSGRGHRRSYYNSHDRSRRHRSENRYSPSPPAVRNRSARHSYRIR